MVPFDVDDYTIKAELNNQIENETAAAKGTVTQLWNPQTVHLTVTSPAIPIIINPQVTIWPDDHFYSINTYSVTIPTSHDCTAFLTPLDLVLRQ